MIDELRQIAIFAKTIEHGSFRATAQALRLSPSVVSHHVAQLEQRLGTALLYRTTRKLSLTPDGERLLSAAQTMIQAAEAGIQDITNKTQQPTGVIRLTVPAIMANSPMTAEFARFALTYPDVRITLDYSDLRRELIEDGFDVAISIGGLKDSSFKAKKLFEIQRKLVASPSYLASQQAVNSPSDLDHLDWLELAPVWNIKPLFLKGKKREVVSNRNSRISVNNAHALCQLARTGAGLALIPDFLVEPDIKSGELVTVIDDWNLEPLNVYAVWPANVPKEGLIMLFLKFLSENIN